MNDYILLGALVAGAVCLYRIASNTSYLRQLKPKGIDDVPEIKTQVLSTLDAIKHRLDIEDQDQEKVNIITAEKIDELSRKIDELNNDTLRDYVDDGLKDLRNEIRVEFDDMSNYFRIGLDEFKKEMTGKAKKDADVIRADKPEKEMAMGPVIPTGLTGRTSIASQIKKQKEILATHPFFKGTEPITSQETHAKFGMTQSLFSNRLSIKAIKLNRYRVGQRVYFRLDDVLAEVERLQGGFARSIK